LLASGSKIREAAVQKVQQQVLNTLGFCTKCLNIGQWSRMPASLGHKPERSTTVSKYSKSCMVRVKERRMEVTRRG